MYGFDVLNANGNHLCMTEAYAASRDHKGDCLNPKTSSKVFVTVKSLFNFPLKPGADITDSTDLAKLFIFPEAGTYTVQARRYDEISKGVVKSNVAMIAVVNN